MSAAQTHGRRDGVPRFILIGAALMITFAVLSSYYARVTGLGRVALQGAEPFKVLQLRFVDMPNGSVEVRDAERGDAFYVVEPGKGGFLRATLRTMAQARMRDDKSAATPFRLTRWTDGTLSLDDPATGRDVGLDAFGPDNAGLFAQLFTKREETK